MHVDVSTWWQPGKGPGRRPDYIAPLFQADGPKNALPILTLRDAERGALAQSLLHSYCSSTAEVSGVRCEASDGDSEV